MPKPDRETFRVELRAEGPGPPVAMRLKRWLKAALRSYGLRCIRIEPADAAEVEPETPVKK